MRRRLSLPIVLVAFFVVFVAAETTKCSDACVYDCGGGGSGGRIPPPGGGAPPGDPLTRAWWSTADPQGGTFTNWCGPICTTAPPDHHDVLGEHAVDIGAPADTQVWYYDPRPNVFTPNIVRADLVWSPACADGSGGQAAIISLHGLDAAAPGGSRYLANAVYRHITQGTIVTSVVNPTLLGTVTPNASTNPDCWDGAHVHQGVGSISSDVTFEHNTAGFPDPNCLPYEGQNPDNIGVVIGYPFCYQIRWKG